MLGILNNFLSSLLGFIIKLFFLLLSLIGALIIYPIQVILVTAFPAIGEFFSSVMTYFTQSVFPMIGFVKDCVLGIICLPSSLWNALIGILIFRIAAVPSIRFIKLFINIRKIWFGDVNLK